MVLQFNQYHDKNITCTVEGAVLSTYFVILPILTGRFLKIAIYYPQRGHSFNDCDRDFATVKRKIRRLDRIYSPQEYENLIKSSSNSGKFTVKHVIHKDIAAFKTWWPSFFKKKVLSNRSYGRAIPKDQKSYFAVNNFYEFVFSSEEPGVIIAKPFIDSFVEERFSVLKKNNSPLFIPNPEDNPAYQEKIPINVKKIEDIKKLYQYIPDNYKEYYNEINEWPTTTTDEVAEDL